MLPIGLSSTLYLNLDLNQIVEKLAEYGYASLEIVADVPQKWSEDFDKKEQQKLAETLQSFGLQSSIHAPIWDINIASHITSFRNISLDQIKWSMDLAQNLGSKLIVLHPGHMPPFLFVAPLREKCKTNFINSLQNLLNYSLETGVPVGLENIPLNLSFCHKLEHLIEYANHFENLKVTLDIAHAYMIEKFLQLIEPQKVSSLPEERIAEAIIKLGKRIINIHLHDNDGSFDQHKIPGEGTINFKPIMKVLREINYNGLITLETYGAKDPDKSAQDAKNATEKLLKL